MFTLKNDDDNNVVNNDSVENKVNDPFNPDAGKMNPFETSNNNPSPNVTNTFNPNSYIDSAPVVKTNPYDMNSNNSYSTSSNKVTKCSRPNWSYILFLSITVIVAVFLFNNLYKAFKGRSIISHGQKVIATVTDYDVHYGRRRSSRTYDIYVSYKVDGNWHSDVFLMKSKKIKYIGESIIIYCDKSNPDRIACDDSVKENIRGAIICLVIAIIMGFAAFKAHEDQEKFNRKWVNSINDRPRRYRRY